MKSGSEPNFLSSNKEIFEDGQTGGADGNKMFNYSFNTKVKSTESSALVPYKGAILQYLQNLLDDGPASELCKEVLYRAEYKMVRKIIETGEYNFENPKQLDKAFLNFKRKTTDQSMRSHYLPSATQSVTNFNGSSTNFNHNVEAYILYKQIKKKEKRRNKLDPISESKSNKSKHLQLLGLDLSHLYQRTV